MRCSLPRLPHYLAIISEKNLEYDTEVELHHVRQPQGVTYVTQMLLGRGNEEIQKRRVLTINRTTQAKKVKLCTLKSTVRPFVPSPGRCLKCQKCGHGSQPCTRKLTGANCAEIDHSSEHSQNSTMNCRSLRAPHPAYSPNFTTSQYRKDIYR